MPTQMSPNLNLPLPNATSEDLRFEDIVAIKGALIILDQKINRQIVDNPTKLPSYNIVVNRAEPNENGLLNYLIQINTFGVAGGTTIDLVENTNNVNGFEKAAEGTDFTITPKSVVLVGDKRNGATATAIIETNLNSDRKKVVLKVGQPPLIWDNINVDDIFISKYYDLPTINTSCSVYGNGTYIALGINASFASVSTDGINWRNKPITEGVYDDIVFGNGIFVTCERNSQTTYTTVNGINWNTGSVLGVADNHWEIIFGNGVFVAVATNRYGGNVDQNIVKTSTDGVNWTTHTLPTSNNWRIYPIGNGQFAGYALWTTYAFTTADFETYLTQPIMPLNQGNYFVSSGQINGVTKYVAVDNSLNSYVSNDGITWTLNTLTKSTGWQGICYGGNKFVVISGISDTQNTGSQAMYSTDGINWTYFSIQPKDIWTTILYDGTNFIVNGYGQYQGSSVETLNI